MATDSAQLVTYAINNRVATLTLNRPQAANAFNAELRAELGAAIKRAQTDDEVRVIVLTGAGKVFCAGADISGMGDPDADAQQQILTEYQPALLDIAAGPKPVIAAVNGAAAGIGASFAMACDLAVFADSACIYMAFAHIALVPDGGASWQLLHALGRRRAFEVIAMGQRLSAEECLQVGLANRVVPAADLLTFTQAWAEELAAKSPMATRHAKQILRHAQGASLADTIVFEASFQNACIASNDCKEGVAAFREKRPPVFKGN
jgi:2-(1,2-epoxy-1,2-dihydrophenyl)acetyl-CoA isomerase